MIRRPAGSTCAGVFLALGLACLVVAPAHAADGGKRARDFKVSDAETEHPVMPHHIVTNIIDTFTERLEQVHGKPADVREEMIGELVDQHFSAYLDMETISREIFGEHWTVLEEQGLTLQAMAKVRKSFRKRYIKAISKYDRQRIRVFRTKVDRSDDGDARVHVKVDARLKTLPVDVYFHQMPNGEWRIYDLKVLGTSFVYGGQKTFQAGIRHYGLDRVLNEIEMTVED